MLDRILLALTLASALGCGLIAGVFFAFSTFVMKALDRLPSPQGIAAMQFINIAVINPWFMLVFLGTAAACLVLAVSSILRWHNPGAPYLLWGSLLYLFGTILVTMAFNVPRKDALAALDPATTPAARLWPVYVRSWTAWNHVRTAAAVAASALFILALCLPGPKRPWPNGTIERNRYPDARAAFRIVFAARSVQEPFLAPSVRYRQLCAPTCLDGIS